MTIYTFIHSHYSCDIFIYSYSTYIFRILSGSSKEVRCLIGSYCRPTSVVSWLTDTVLKIRLFGLATPWSGDIPLEAVMGKRKSFMVKLPLRDKLGSTTIWCTILTEELAGQV